MAIGYVRLDNKEARRAYHSVARRASLLSSQRWLRGDGISLRLRTGARLCQGIDSDNVGGGKRQAADLLNRPKRFRIQAVKNPAPIPGVGHNAGFAQYPQVVGHGGLGHVERAEKCTYATFFAGKHSNNFQTGLVAQRLKDFGKSLVVQHGRINGKRSKL